MHNDKYYRSKIPVSLVLLYLLNLLVVIALELLVLYPVPVPLTEQALAEYDRRYEGSTILYTADRGKLSCHLVETADGELLMVPTHSHSLTYKRAKVLRKYIVSIPEDEEITVPVKVGLHTSNVTVGTEALTGNRCITIDYYGSSIRNATTLYMVIAAALEAMELAIFHLIRHGFA